jgi:hypothetical protein
MNSPKILRTGILENEKMDMAQAASGFCAQTANSL